MTRALILEVAGRLFAEKGYADTASKTICENACANVAAVNYHFGSRDGLYMAVLKEAHEHFLSIDLVTGLADSTLPPQSKLDGLIEAICENLVNTNQWRTRLLARELLTPSPFMSEFYRSESMPAFNGICRILAEILELPSDDPAVTRCALNLIAPFTMLLIAHPDLPGPVQIVQSAMREHAAEHMKAFVRGGLEAVRASCKKAQGTNPRKRPQS